MGAACAGRTRLAVALVNRGLGTTVAGAAANLRHSPRGRPGRASALAAVLTAAYLAGGCPGLVCGVLTLRLLVYPQLAWMSGGHLAPLR
ncbi:hypothetical protein [Streptomyces platensis]|uniref:hypothetical protein n=1 Tax=Streptomyces platensis TaxID=58346 RepID=UPI001F4461DE|nr:hypothetical protein [Streptomyces platensis]MCF3143767.1 hypothetical protein [Streptomyces platensis]